MIIDMHTHAFPPAFAERRADLLGGDATFAELYHDPRAKLATCIDVLDAMERAAVDVSVVCGFAWGDAALCREHNDYLLQAAANSRGRLFPFCTLPLSDPDAACLEAERCIRGGARGFGELRPESQGVSLSDRRVSEALTSAAEAGGLPVLIHASEPVGHRYPGKQGQQLGTLYDFIVEHGALRVVAAHWGGGLPLFALMPEVKASLANVWVDTAATTLLYDNAIFRTVARLLGVERILYGSDFPLLSPRTQIANIRSTLLSGDEERLVLGGNAARLLGLEDG